mmetsp:Transcript_39884/g.122807  ORF Transcript_39884/g.122807 Transcript_39884/m.122807 type:complete len:177 (+) Transcript_39884:39-569(+)
MRLLRLACLALAVHSSRALRLVPTEGRRAALGRGVAAAATSAAAASAAATAALRPAAAMASTAAELTGVQAGFDEAAEKRARYQAMQKDYKKAWRKQLSNLEFSDSDGEALEAIKAIIKLIREHGNEIPQGVRKQDLDQVYKRVQPNLSKPVRMAFLDLDGLVQKAVTVKDLRADE